MTSAITPVILTYNEAPNLARTLERLRWADQVVVLDSFSTDDTEQIARSHPNTVFHQRTFDDHAKQWNYGVNLAKTEWVLSLDADYVLQPGLVSELESLEPDPAACAYYIRFRYCVFGKPLRASLYPSRAALFRKGRCRYVLDGHTQRLEIDGATASLENGIDHDDRKPLSRWLWSQDRYAAAEVDKLLGAPADSLSMQDKLRRLVVVAPFAALIYSLLIRGTVLDGPAGWHYAFQRMTAELILSLRLLERKLLS